MMLATRHRPHNGNWWRNYPTCYEHRVKYIDPANHNYHRKSTISVYDMGKFDTRQKWEIELDELYEKLEKNKTE